MPPRAFGPVTPRNIASRSVAGACPMTPMISTVRRDHWGRFRLCRHVETPFDRWRHDHRVLTSGQPMRRPAGAVEPAPACGGSLMLDGQDDHQNQQHLQLPIREFDHSITSLPYPVVSGHTGALEIPG